MGYKQIKLSNGKITFVDQEDFERLSKYKWYCLNNNYAATTIYLNKDKTKVLLMHRFLMDNPRNKIVDHANMNTLDNRKVNLRVCTKAQNQANHKLNKLNTSGYNGVTWNKRRNMWQSQISIKNENKVIGNFFGKEEAALAFNFAAIQYRGKFSRLNCL